jgi:hypothetical protein
MRCGLPATTIVPKTFNWYPIWILILIIPASLVGGSGQIGEALAKPYRVSLFAPMCEAHQKHWSERTRVIYGSLLLWIVFIVGGFVFLAATARQGKENPFASFLCPAMFVSLLAWVILTLTVENTTIRMIEHKEDHITLTGVAEEFVQAVEKQHKYRELESG